MALRLVGGFRLLFRLPISLQITWVMVSLVETNLAEYYRAYQRIFNQQTATNRNLHMQKSVPTNQQYDVARVF